MKLSNMKTLLKPTTLFGLLAIAGVIIAFNCYTRTREGFDGSKELLLLHMNGCGHCEKLMPEWKNFVANNDTNIKPRDVEMNEDPDLIKKYNVKGFPTILLLGENGKKLDTYDGPRTSDGLLNYCKTK